MMGSSCFACPTSFLIVLVGALRFSFGNYPSSNNSLGSLGGASPTSYTRGEHNPCHTFCLLSQSDRFMDGHRKKLVQSKTILELSEELLEKRSSLPTEISKLGEIKFWICWRFSCLHVWRLSLREKSTQRNIEPRDRKRNWVLITLFEHKDPNRPETNTSGLLNYVSK